MEGKEAAHVILVPYPAQGHINPMLQLGKRLAFHGLRTTMAIPRFHLKTAKPEPGPVRIEPISDGFDDGGFAQAADTSDYLSRFESAGSKTLEDLISAQQAMDRPVRCLVYDPFVLWALEVGKRLGLVCAAFFTQSCAVDAIYWHVWQGRLRIPVEQPVESLPGLPPLDPADLPSFLVDPPPGPYPAYLSVLMNQFCNLDRADAVLINSFYELEREAADWMISEWNVLTIGPTVPSKYLDDRVPGDSHYGFHLWNANTESCLKWLDSKPPSSVVYVSFGSMASVGNEYMEELAEGLRSSGKNFLWVVRESEAGKLPANFIEETMERGFVVPWSPQLEVLAHGAVGCFVTHCGWNSITEALSLGVPMVAVPQWTDQKTGAKYVRDVWEVGVRAGVDEKGILRREEMKRCTIEVMEGESGEKLKKNASKWKDLAKQAVMEGGSSDKNIVKFISKCCS